MTQIDNSENNKRIAKNTILLSIRMVFVLFLGFYTTRVTLSALGINDFGVYNVVGGFVSMFAFLNTSMSNGIQRFFNFELGRNGVEGARKVYVISLIIQSILLLAIVLLTETLGLWYLNNKMVIPAERFGAAQWVFQFSVLSFMLIIMQVPYNAAIMAHECMNFYAFIGILDAVLKLVIVILIPYADCDLLILYSALIAGISLLDFILAFTYAKKHFEEISIKPLFEREFFKSMLSFSGWNIFGTFANMMREQGLNMILNLFFGPVVNAARGVAFQVTGGLQGFVANISTAMRPQIVQSYSQGNYARTISLMQSLSKVSICFLYIVAYPIVLEIDYVLNLWLGRNVPEHTSTFIIIVILIAFLSTMNGAVSAVVHASGKMRKYQLVGSLITLSSIPFAYYSLSIGGSPESVFWVSFILTVFMQIASLLVLKGIVDFSLLNYAKQVLKPFFLLILCSFVFPLIPYYYLDEGLLRFLMVFVVSVLTSGLTFYLVGLSCSEKKIIHSFVAKILRINNK